MRVFREQTVEQGDGFVVLTTVGQAAHLQHAWPAEGFPAPQLKQLHQRGCLWITLGGVDGHQPGLQSVVDGATGHGVAGHHIVKPRTGWGFWWRVGEPACAGFQITAGQGQIGGAHPGQLPAGANGGYPLPEAVAGGRLSRNFGISHQFRELGLQGRIQWGGAGLGGDMPEDQELVATARFQGQLPVGLQLGEELLPQLLRMGVAPLAVLGGQGFGLLAIRAVGMDSIHLRSRPEPPYIGHQGEGRVEQVGFCKSQISLIAIAGQQPGTGQLQSSAGVPKLG